MSFLLIASLILPLCFLVRQMARKGAFDEVLSLWHHAPLIARIVAVLSFLCAFTYGSDKQAGSGINRIMSRMGRSIAGAALRCFSPTEQATGYAVCAIGTDEVHDLSLSPNGVLVESIARRGAHDDGFWHSDSFTNQLWHAGLVDERKIWIHTDGTITFKAPSFGIAPSELSAISVASNCTVYAPRYGSYGFLPTFHWDNIVTSRLWTAVSDRHTRMITWEGALEERLANHIFSFQVEFFDGGDILYRYSPSVGTNCEVGLFRNGALQLIDLPMNTTSVLLSYIGDLTDGTGDSDNDGLSDWEEVMVTGTNPHPPRPTSGAIDEREIPQWFDLFPQDCDGDGILDYSETGGVSQCSKFLWYDTSNGENLLQGEVGDVNNRIVHGELYYSVQMDGESHQYFSLDVNGLVYLPFSTNQLGVTTSYDRNRDLAEWENNKGHIAIAAFWSDLRSRVNANTKILLANDVKNSQTIVEYQNISCNYAETNEVASFQVILPHNRPNTFYVSYRNCTEKFQELYPTLGVQNSRIHNPKQPNSRYNITYSYGVQNAFPTNTTLIYHLGHWTNPDDADTDQDGLTDFEEITQHKTNPLSTDTDNDGIVDPQEIEYKTNPLKADSDFDDLPDKWELENGLNPRSAYGENGLNGDPDNDGLNNVKELSLGTNPKLSDTDRDGLDDKKEAGWIELGRNLIPFDCSGGTTLSNSSNYDSHCFKVPLPFPIRIGGVLSTNIVVAVNGIVGLLDAQNASAGFIATDLNSDFRTSSHNRVHTTIAAYWDDLYASPANFSRISTADVVKDNKRYFVVEYKDIRPYLGRAIPNNIGTFQVVIPEAETNTIFVQYVTLSGTMNCGSATLGAQVANRRVNLPFSYNQNYSITEGSVITYHLGTGGSPLLFDTDSDGLNDGIEATIQTSSSREDSDGDGLSDLWEYNCGTSPISAYGDDGEFGDPDGDKLLNKEECRNGTDPFNQDTDGDGLDDFEEVGGIVEASIPWMTLMNSMDITHCFNNEDGITNVPLSSPILVNNKNLTVALISKYGVVSLGRNEDPNEEYSHWYGNLLNHSYSEREVFIAPFWNKMEMVTNYPASKILIGDGYVSGNPCFVVEYQNMKANCNRDSITNRISFQLSIPYGETDRAFIQYKNVAKPVHGQYTSVGFQCDKGRQRHSYCYSDEGKVYSGLSLEFRFGKGTNPTSMDTDGDKLFDLQEVLQKTNPHQPDSDGDGFHDGWEVDFGFEPNAHNENDNDGSNDRNADPDEDGLTNQEECMWNTNPYAEDSDGDGVADGEEISQYSDPDDLTDEGRPGSRAPISFTFGDPSGSYSEKYRLVIKPLSPSWRTVYSDEMPKTVEWVNANYGECETKLALLARGFDYEVRLYHAGTNESDNPDYDYRFIISPSPYVGIMIDDPDELQQESDGTSHYFSGEGKVIRLRVLDASIVADYNRDGQIDEIDLAQTYKGRVFRHWINGDNDNGDFSMGNQDMPRQGGSYNPITWANCEDGDMNGRCDLLDFAPIHLNIGNMLMHLEDELHHYQFTLSQQDEAVSVVWTTLEANRANAFLKEDFTTFGENLNGVSFWAHVTSIESDKGTELPNSFLQLIQNDPRFGIIMVEGVEESTTPLIFKCYRKSGENSSDANLVFQLELPMKISNVEDMFRFHNIRFSPSLANRNGEPRNLPDDECDNIDIFLTHGFLVAENESRAWGSEFFKRLWQEGSRARFHNVTWSSNTGSSVSYEENVNNAFLSSASYASLVNSIKQTNQSRIVVMAHSLGNMLTSSAIEDHGLDADAYFALNAAVPTEAYDATMANITTNAANPLLHSDWYGYKPNTWASNFCSLYLDEDVFPNDDRAKLTWRGRFASVPQIMYNFWSSGDEVLEIKDTSQAALYVTDGIEVDWRWNIMPISLNARRYVWQKQALFKGRSSVYGTTWAGWEFEANISPENANRLSDFALRIYPIFQHSPNMMFSSTISEENRNNILARGIPELSYPLGYTNLVKNVFRGDFDMNDRFMRRLDEVWPQRDIDFNDAGNTRPNRWLHTDLMNVAHYFTFKLFSKIVELGELK